MRGLLIKIRDLGLSLIPVHCIEPETCLYRLGRNSATASFVELPIIPSR